MAYTLSNSLFQWIIYDHILLRINGTTNNIGIFGCFFVNNCFLRFIEVDKLSNETIIDRCCFLQNKDNLIFTIGSIYSYIKHVSNYDEAAEYSSGIHGTHKGSVENCNSSCVIASKGRCGIFVWSEGYVRNEFLSFYSCSGTFLAELDPKDKSFQMSHFAVSECNLSLTIFWIKPDEIKLSINDSYFINVVWPGSEFSDGGNNCVVRFFGCYSNNSLIPNDTTKMKIVVKADIMECNLKLTRHIQRKNHLIYFQFLKIISAILIR